MISEPLRHPLSLFDVKGKVVVAVKADSCTGCQHSLEEIAGGPEEYLAGNGVATAPPTGIL